ncbi:hypothetical protein [Pontibacter harenae]|uniref:hypothetical protein n=1 Tax=Pontibacter harenae TaxID=2894083 RepID=UPI001E5F13E2|nr:hypothetical protein [Pontibacter harenae]MCC9166342.1 hypothetical protein [Pontibacter harenae]
MKTLKKILLSMLALGSVFAFQTAHAQPKAYEQGGYIFNAGISLGSYGYGYVGSRSGGFIPVTVSVEKSFHEYISAGPYLGYASWNYNGSGWRYSWNYVTVGGRVTFHGSSLINEHLDADIDEKKLDLYGSVISGLEFRKYSGDDFNVYDYGNEIKLIFGPILGAKYMFDDQVGAYVEGGRGTFGYVTVGVSLNF